MTSHYEALTCRTLEAHEQALADTRALWPKRGFRHKPRQTPQFDVGRSTWHGRQIVSRPMLVPIFIFWGLSMLHKQVLNNIFFVQVRYGFSARFFGHRAGRRPRLGSCRVATPPRRPPSGDLILRNHVSGAPRLPEPPRNECFQNKL